MAWKASQNRIIDCYICVVETTGFTVISNSKSAIRPVLHHSDIPLPQDEINVQWQITVGVCKEIALMFVSQEF